MKKKFKKKSIKFERIQEIVNLNKSKKRRNKEIINENLIFLKEASKKKLDEENFEPFFIPQKKVNETKRKKVIDLLFEEKEKNNLIEKPILPQEEKNKNILKIFETKQNKIFLEKVENPILRKVIDIIEEPISNFIISKITQIYNYIDSKIQKIFEEFSSIQQNNNKGMFSFGGGGSLERKIENPTTTNNDIAVLDDGILLDTKITTIDFIGEGIKVLSLGNGVIKVFVPPILFSPFFNSGSAKITPETTFLRNISFPDSEGNPFKRGTIIGKFETTKESICSFTTINPFSILNNTSTQLSIKVFDADEITILASLTQTITGNFDTGIIDGLKIQLNSFTTEAEKFSGIASFFIDLNTVLNGKSGKIKIRLEHNNLTDGIYFFEQDLFYDSQSLIGSIDSVSFSENIPVIKYLSGIRYYTINSSFNINVLNISNHNSDSYPDKQLKITAYNINLPSKEYSGSELQNYNTQYNNNNVNLIDTLNINTSNYRYRGTEARISARILDWIPEDEVFSAPMSILIDTYGVTSSKLIRTFDDEFHRLENDYITAWDSSRHLTNFEALVFDGFLMAPTKSYLSNLTNNSDWTSFNPLSGQPNYSSLTSLPVSYFTKFEDDDIDRSGFTIIFEGHFVIDALNDLLNEDLKIFIRRVAGNGNTGTTCVPLTLHGGFYNFHAFDDGLTLTGSRILEASSSGNIINATFGNFSCRQGIYMGIQINNENIKIDTISIEFF